MLQGTGGGAECVGAFCLPDAGVWLYDDVGQQGPVRGGGSARGARLVGADQVSRGEWKGEGLEIMSNADIINQELGKAGVKGVTLVQKGDEVWLQAYGITRRMDMPLDEDVPKFAGRFAKQCAELEAGHKKVTTGAVAG
jgi:hypothetical protein